MAGGAEGQIAGLYDLGRTLGKGHFAVVRLARHVFTGERVAVKVIDKGKLEAAAAAQLLQEVRCMKLVQHPNVVRLYQVIDTQARLYLVLELGEGGDLFDYLARHEGGLAEGQAKRYFAQIVHAISYCHRLHVVHRDLKPENVVFFQEGGVVKLTDFGFSNCFQPGTMLTTSCGSLAYSAPEILLGDEYDAPAVDIWSLGVILYMLVCGQPPFQEANDSETLTMILDCRYVIPAHVSHECTDLISRMLRRNPQQRASLGQIEGHPWLQGVDPSPASRSLLPLTSHRGLSDEEHSAILQAMVGGRIADRETVQEALEADRYNHITATYFLLAERILREKQRPGRSLVESLAQQVQPRGRDPSQPAPPLASLPTSRSAQGSFAEGPFQPPSAWGQEEPCRGFHGCSQPIRALLNPSLLETPLAKSTPALQQISEEEEEEEGGEEEEEGRAGLFRRRTSSLNQEQMSDFQSAKASLLFCRSFAGHSRGGKGFGAGPVKPPAPEQPRAVPGLGMPRDLGGLHRVSQREREGGMERTGPCEPLPAGCLWVPGGAAKRTGGGRGQEGSGPLPWARGGAAEEELLEGGAGALGQGPGLQDAPGGGDAPPGLGGKPTEPAHGLEAGGGRWPDGGSRGSGREGLAESATRLDPAKGKGGNLRERILQFPLCEKAFALRMQPSAKDGLLSLGQFNCCHVI